MQISIHACTGNHPTSSHAHSPGYSTHTHTHTHLYFKYDTQFLRMLSQASRCAFSAFISAEASSELCVVPVTIPSPQRWWNAPMKNTIISSSLRELSAGGKISSFFFFTFVRKCTSWSSYSSQFEQWKQPSKLITGVRVVAGGLHSVPVTLAALLSVD